jgi:CDP-diacylglycerol---glycerol-3-phosphate 3-phosphatidyltransferase
LNLPNSITLLRILFIPLLVFLLLSTSLPHNSQIAVVVFVCVAVSDWFDGYLARKLKQETTLGKFLDPLADKILVITALICLVELKAVSSIPVMIIVVRDFAVTALRLAAASTGRIIAADRLGKYKAFVLDVAAAMLIINLPYSVWVLWAGVALAVVSGIDYFARNKEVLYG